MKHKFQVVQDSASVCCVRGPEGINYPQFPPFLPSNDFPELKGKVTLSKRENSVYPTVRQLFCDYGLDVENFDDVIWNPLGTIVSPGDTVLVKPNLVRHFHMEGGDYSAVVTNGSVIRCVMDYIAIALQGEGKIILGDAPVQSANFEMIVEKNGLREVVDSVTESWGIPVELVDFRLVSIELDENHCLAGTTEQVGDPLGYMSVDLANESMLTPVSEQFERFRVTSYDCKEMTKHHNDKTHEYLISKSIIEADVVINLPKLKTHRKVCVTASLKNLVGINGHKDWLPHHRCGSLAEGGDEYLNPSSLKYWENYFKDQYFLSDNKFAAVFNGIGRRIFSRLISILSKDTYREGSWYGNDTTWRMALDLNRLLMYTDKKGQLCNTVSRKLFTIVDAVVAGDGEGPMAPNPRDCGLLVCGMNPVAVDTFLTTLMGFDYNRIPLIREAYNISNYNLVNFSPKDISIVTNDPDIKKLRLGAPYNEFKFLPPAGWCGNVENY